MTQTIWNGRAASYGRRHVLAGALASGAASLLPRGGSAAGAPWAEPPAGKRPDKVSALVWAYGEVFTSAFSRFTQDWQIPVDATIAPFAELPKKTMAMFAGNTPLDVSMSSALSFSSWLDQDFVETLDGLPGAADYIADFTPISKQCCIRDGKLMALPLMSAVWVWNYNSELLEKVGAKPFTTYEELTESSLKAKKDKISEFPILWVGAAGGEYITFTWYQLVWNRGSAMFDKDGHHLLGPGSVARETLRWWAKTFADGISDPNSLNVVMNQSAQVFSQGKTLYRGPNQHYGITFINDPKQSPIAGKGVMWGSPGDGRTIASPHFFYMTTATNNKPWAWMLMQSLGGKTRDGKYTLDENVARDAMFGPAYTSLLQSPVVLEGWKKWADPRTYTEISNKATYSADVCNAINEPWYLPWSNHVEIELQKTLTGAQTADQCCDALIAAIGKSG